MICDFSVNKNGVQLNEETIDTWLQTLCNKPVVGKVEKNQFGVDDFTSHNAKLVTKIDDDGNEYNDVEFDTLPFGSFKSVSIEEIDGINYIVAEAELWKRYENACNVIMNRINAGNLYTSWEVGVIKSRQSISNGKIVKIIDEGKFLAHCCLSAMVSPAYDSSRLLQVASDNSDTELADALSKDMVMLSDINIKKEQEDNNLGKEKNISTSNVAPKENQIAETPVDNTLEIQPDSLDFSSLTEWDLRKAIQKACREKLDVWCWIAWHFPMEKKVWCEFDGRESELDFKLFTYEVENDVITVSEPMDVKLTVSIAEINTTLSEKNEALIQANNAISQLEKEIEELSEFKEAFEQVEAEKAEAEKQTQIAELKEYVENANCFSEEEINSEEVSTLISELKKPELQAMIADKIVSNLTKGQKEKKNTKEVSEKKIEVSAKPSLVVEDDVVDYGAVMKSFLSK